MERGRGKRWTRTSQRSLDTGTGRRRETERARRTLHARLLLLRAARRVLESRARRVERDPASHDRGPAARQHMECAGRAVHMRGDAPSLLDDLARLERRLERRVERRRPGREERGPAGGRLELRQSLDPSERETSGLLGRRRGRGRECREKGRGRGAREGFGGGQRKRSADARDLAIHARPRGANLVLRDGVRLEHVGEAAGPDLDGARGCGAREGVRERLLVRRGLLRGVRGASQRG